MNNGSSISTLRQEDLMKKSIKGSIFAGLVAVGSLVASPAMAAGSVLSISDGVLLGKGSGVQVTISFVCDLGQTYGLNVTLRQRVSQGLLTSGSSGENGDCTGSTQSSTYVISPSVRQGTPPAYKNGSALVTADIFTCSPEFVCESATVSREISVRK